MHKSLPKVPDLDIANSAGVFTDYTDETVVSPYILFTEVFCILFQYTYYGITTAPRRD